VNLPLDILLAGFGGQGILLAGRVLAGAALRAGRNVLVNNYYEGFVRGGISECTIVIASGEIGSPVRSRPMVVAALDARAVANWGAKTDPRGMLLVNVSLIGDVLRPADRTVHAIPATELATSVGNPMGASLAMVGALASLTGAVALTDCTDALEEAMPAHRRAHLEKNLAALRRGAAFASTEILHGAL